MESKVRNSRCTEKPTQRERKVYTVETNRIIIMNNIQKPIQQVS